MNQGEHFCRVLVVLFLFFFVGCGGSNEGGQGSSARTARVRIQIGDASTTRSTAGGAAVTRQRLAGIPPEVTDIALRVTTNDQDIPGSPFTIPLETGALTVEISANMLHTFTVEAHNQRGNTIFHGTETLTLAPGATQPLTLPLEANTIVQEVARQFLSAATGGEVVVDDSVSPVFTLRLSVPSATLPEDLTVIITETYNPPDIPPLPNQVGTMVDILPSGTNFAQPVTLTFPYDATLVDALGFDVTTLLLHRFDPVQQRWVMLPIQRVQIGNGVVIAQLSSLSFYALAGGGPPVVGNRLPVAVSQTVTVAEDATAAIPLTGSDVDGDPLTFRVVTPPARGTLQGTAPVLTYVPEANANGTDVFTYVVNDGSDDSALATITLNITPGNDPPEVRLPLGVVRLDDQHPATSTRIDLSATFTDVDVATNADVLHFRVQDNTSPTLLTTTLTGTTLTLIYQPNQNGTAAVTVRATDQQGLFMEDTLQVVVERTFPFTLNLSRLNDVFQRIQQQDE